jgi:hypothetical protein
MTAGEVAAGFGPEDRQLSQQEGFADTGVTRRWLGCWRVADELYPLSLGNRESSFLPSKPSSNLFVLAREANNCPLPRPFFESVFFGVGG